MRANFFMADLIVTNGKIITVDKNFSFVESMAVKDGRILAVGKTSDILELKGKDTKVVDLKGKTVIPGINDNHCHLTWTIVSVPPYQLDLSHHHVHCIEDMRKLVKEAVAKAKPGQWILGAGWNEGVIKELVEDNKRLLGKKDIDDISPNNPVWMREFSYHTAFVNSKALEAANITRNTPDPVGGNIEKDASGEPIGFLVETANALIEHVVPKFTVNEMIQAFKDNVSFMSAYGVTSVTTASERPNDVNLYSRLYRETFKTNAHFPIRVNILMLWSDYALGGAYKEINEALKSVGVATNFGNEWVKIGGIKLFADGVPMTQTAWVSAPYADGSHGSLVVPGSNDKEKLEELERVVNICHDNGYQLGVHCAGDKTVEATVDAMAKAMERDPWDARHYVIHADYVQKRSMELMQKYNIGVSTQSELKFILADDMIQRRGPEIAAEQFPLKELLDKKIHVANGSDTPCSYPDWRLGIQSAVLRESMSGVQSGKHQCLSVREALETYTINGAWLDHMEDVKGSLEPGKLADFVVIGQDITTCDPHKIVETPILATFVGGYPVWSDGSIVEKYDGKLK